jgi:deazaflavin-dependent oxidoreductase (nitroreductase family)
MPTTMRDRFNKVMGRMHRAAYRSSKGKVGGRLGKAPMLLLTTTGRRSGQPRTVPLIYLPDGERYVVAASNAGQGHDPAWYGNAQAQPAVEIEVGERRIPVTARVADAGERAELWPRLVGIFGNYAKYERRTDRPIPVVILEPR